MRLSPYTQKTDGESMADRRSGAPAMSNQAALSALGWQQLLNANATAGLLASASRGLPVPVPQPDVGPVAVAVAGARAPYQAVNVQRHQLGAAGRAALHNARQVRPDQLQLGGAMEWQFVQVGLADANVAPLGVVNLQQLQQQQHLHLLRQQQLQHQQQLHQLQQQQLQQQHLQQQQLLLQQQRQRTAAAQLQAAVRVVGAGAVPVGHLHEADSIAIPVAPAAVALAGPSHSSSSPALASSSLASTSAAAAAAVFEPASLLTVSAADADLHQVPLLHQFQQQLQQHRHHQALQQLAGGQGPSQPQAALFAHLGNGYQQSQFVALAGSPAGSPLGSSPLSAVPQQLLAQPHLKQQQLQQHQQQQPSRSRLRAVRPLSATALALIAAGNAAAAGVGDTATLSHSAHSSGSSARTPVSTGLLGHNSNSSSANLAGVTAAATIGGGAAGGGGGCNGDSSATERCDDLDLFDGASTEAGSAADSDDFVSPNHPICETASSWASLTAGLLARVMGVVAAGGALPVLAPAMRCVCRHWRSVVDAHLECLSPAIMKVRSITTRFASLRALHLDHCANIRNRDLRVLARAPPAQLLHTLTLGDDRARPWVSNRGLASVCRITSLTRLTLCDCMSITNRGLSPLSGLTGLTSLSLRGCRKLTNQGVESLRGLKLLQHLSLYGVVRLSDKGLVPLGALPALRSLELGHTRVRDEGLGHAARLTGLRSLSLVREEVTDAGVRQLSVLTGLTRLVLRDTVEVSGETLAVVLPVLRELQVLDVQRNWSFNNMQLARCLPALLAAPALTSLDLRATWVCDEGVAALARIPSLRRLAISPQHEHWCKYLNVLPQLQQLTALVFRNLPTLPYQLLEVLAALPDLRELDVSEPPPAVEGAAAAGGWAAAAAAAAAAVAAKEPLRPFAVAALARLRVLRHLDLSRRNLLPDQALFLAMCMPSLERLVAVQCPLPPAAVARLWQQRPQLVIVAGSTAQQYYNLQLLQLHQQLQAAAAGGGGGSGGGGGEHQLLLEEADAYFANA